MQIRGLDVESVDHLVAKFYASMLKSMRTTMDVVTHSFSLVAATSKMSTSGESVEPTAGSASAYENLSAIQVTWAAQVTQDLKPELLMIFSQAGVTVAKPIAKHFGKSDTPVEHAVTQWNDGAIAHMDQAVNRIVAFSDELWSTAKHQLTLGMQDGEGIAELADRVQAVTDVKAKKAHVIAQTEVIAAVNGGEWTQMRASASAFDLVMTKEWHATEDSHTRPTHHAADGQVVPLEQKFHVGDAFLDFPGDPTGQPAEIISCRCTMLYEFDETPQIEPSETSSDAQTASAPVATTGLTAAFIEAEHPRGKNGKFIKKGVDLPGTIFEILGIAKELKYVAGNDSSIGDGFTSTEKKNFAGVVANQLTQSQWNNLKDDDKDIIHKIVEDALDAGAPNSAKASLHLEELDANDDGGPELEDALNVSHVDEGMDFEGDEPGEEGAVAPAVEKAMAQTKTSWAELTADEKLAIYADVVDYMNAHPDDEIAKDAKKHLQSLPQGAASAPPKTTIAKATPIKMTHGLIHAKHTPGEIIARGKNSQGTEITVQWTGSDYKVKFSKPGLNKPDVTVKKSKLYAYLGDNAPNVQWQKPGKTDLTVNTNLADIVGPHAKPLPKNNLFPDAGKDDDLDELFGPLNKGLAPTPPAWGAYPGEPGHVDTTPSLAPEVNTPLTPANTSQKLSMIGWKQVGGQGGSNTGGLFEAPDGQRYYVKSLKSEDHAKNEVLAAALYKAAGVDVPEVRHVSEGAPTGWDNVIASKIVDGKNAKLKLQTGNFFKSQVQDGFAVDAWLANWDTVGLEYDNVIEVNGKPLRIDVGGSLLFRAQGGKKPFGNDVAELDSLKNSSINPQAAKVFGSMTPSQEHDSAKHLLGVTDSQIDQMVSDAGLPSSLADTLKIRRLKILSTYDLDTQNIDTPPADIVIKTLHEVPQTPVALSPMEKAGIFGQFKKGLITDEEYLKLTGELPPFNTVITPSVPPVSAPTPTSGIAHIPFNAKADFYDLFKAEKVSPAWSGAKIWNSLQAAQAKMAGNPTIAQLTTSQMLQIVDQKHGKGGTPYADKLIAWLTTPAGKKAALLAKSTGMPAVSSSPIKKATKATPSALPKVTAADLLGGADITVISIEDKAFIFNTFKNKTKGSYLKDEPKDILKHAKNIADEKDISPLQVLKVIDEKGAQTLGVDNAHLFEKKVLQWAENGATVNDLTNIAHPPAKKAPAVKIGTTGVSTPSFSPSEKHVAPVNLPGVSLKPYDPDKKSTDFKVIQTQDAEYMWQQMQHASPAGAITSSEKAALKKYTGESYGSMNSYLRSGGYASPAIVNAVQKAQLGMRPSTEDLLLHRGNGWFTGWKSIEDAVGNVGKTMHQKAFFSSSVGGTPGYASYAAIRFEIEAPAGTPMAYVDGFSSNQGEKEMLLAAGLRYKVISAIPTGKGPGGGPHVTVRLRVIAEDEV